MTAPVAIAVFGAAGRMGRSIIRIAGERDDVVVAVQMDRSGSSTTEHAISSAFDVLIDFSGAAGFDQSLALALEHGAAFVSGSTGLSDDQHNALRNAAKKIPVLWSANFSIGVAVLRKLVGDAARMLAEFDCEIHETHHRDKKDSPSGTSLVLGRDVAEARGIAFDEHAVMSRVSSHGARLTGEIGFSASRGGDVVGEHVVQLIGQGERLELIHRASDRDIFARGAILAALWLAGKPAGVYSLSDTLR
ncbi:MAG: 4-hydroxy-tetrahydrodipicolinate reductase [Dokdonella sp.]